MEWVKERDLLIEQTLAFVQSVNARKADIKKTDIKRSVTKPDLKLGIETAPIDAIKIVEPAESVPAPRTVPASRAIVSGDIRAEMQARVASFRAHQERFNREREEYCATTLAKVRATLGEDSAPAPLRK
jgi:hypothetical protein